MSTGDHLRRTTAAPLLTAEQEIFLARQVQEGRAEGATAGQKRLARKARQRLILCNMRLVIKAAKKFYSRCKVLTMEDLMQEGVFGLDRATDLFDPTRGYKFSTYATRWVEHWIGRALAEQDSTIRIPVHALDGSKRYARACADHQGKPFDPEEVARSARTNLPTVALYLRAKTVASLDLRHGEGGDLGLMDIIAAPAPEETYLEELGIDPDHLRQSFARLNEEEREVLFSRFGVAGRDAISLEAIGKQLGFSKNRAATVKNRALRRLRVSLCRSEE